MLVKDERIERLTGIVSRITSRMRSRQEMKQPQGRGWRVEEMEGREMEGRRDGGPKKTKVMTAAKTAH
jgi:hypothetical protein